MMISDFRVDALHTFQVSTINRLGFVPRVSLINNSYKCPNLCGDFVVSATVFTQGKKVQFRENMARIPVGGQRDIDCASIVDLSPDRESVVVFHLVPEKFENIQKVAIEKRDLWDLMTAQDHYVEYYDKSGFSAGVLYQCGAFNYEKTSRERSTIIQAPKIYTSESVSTYLLVMHTGFDEPYSVDAHLTMTVTDEAGNVCNQWQEIIAPFCTKMINVSDKVLPNIEARSINPQFSCLYGFSSNATVVPLTISHNAAVGTLAVEHSLPPTYYGSAVTGNVRSRVVSQLKSHKLFVNYEEGAYAN